VGQTNKAFGYKDIPSTSEQSDFDSKVPATDPAYGSMAGQTEAQGTGKVAQKAGQVAQQAQQQAGKAVDQAQQQPGKVAEQVKGQVTSQLDQQKGRAAGTLDSVSLALRDTGQRMHDQGQAPLAMAADKAADQIERLSSYLSERDIAALRAEAENFAREHTPLFLAGAFALGWVGGRFFKSSASNNDAANMGYSGSQAGSNPTSQLPYPY